MSDADTLLAAYDQHLRAYLPSAEGVTVEPDGPLLRTSNFDGGTFITYADLGDLDGPELDALIARQRGFPPPVEWKLHGHDRPGDLPDRLRAAGFVPQDVETVMVAPVARLAAAVPVVPDGVRLREVSGRAELERAATGPGVADGLVRELAADPQALSVVIAEAGDEVVSAGWVRYVPGTGFATLWGGSTVPQWRRRGIYRAIVAYRARLAETRGRTSLQVDASDQSRPILERLGFVALTTTTPYVYAP